jgi:hypothetical protein
MILCNNAPGGWGRVERAYEGKSRHNNNMVWSTVSTSMVL